MSTIIHFIRHGEVENPNRIAYGRMPGFHLNNNGKKEATKAGEFLKGKDITIIYTSPLERTFETANIISDSFKKPMKIVHKYELIEIEASKWQSLPLSELYQNKYFELFFTDPDNDQVPENLNALGKRMEKFALELCTQHRGQEIICVSHDYPIVLLKLKLEKRSLEEAKNLRVDTGSINTLVFDDNCKLIEKKYRTG